MKSYKQVKDFEKSVTKNPYKKALQEFYIYLAETGYRNYKMHKDQNDLTAVADAEAVYCVWEFSQNLDTTHMFSTLTGYQSGFIYMHNSIFDFIGVLFLSTFIVAIIRSVIRKIFEST